jgi:hypothetical protein
LDVEFSGTRERCGWKERWNEKTKRMRGKDEEDKGAKKGRKRKKKSVIPCREHRTFISM